MKRIIFLSFILAISTSSYAQDISVKYSKGSSILNFDVESRALLSSDFGLTYSKNKYAFEVGFARQELLSDAPINEANDIYLDYKSKLESNYLSFYHDIGSIDNFRFSAGLTAGITNFEIYTNLENNSGQNYLDYDFETWGDLGFPIENNYETNLSELNIDELNDYPLSYFYFGPLLECKVELVENFDLTFKSIYKKNLTDLLDNVDVNNLRDVQATNQTDNQMDFLVGVTFNLTKSSKTVSDSLVEVLDSLNVDATIASEELNTEAVISENTPSLESSEKILSREEYILKFFESSNTEFVNEDIDVPAYENEVFEKGDFENEYPYVTSDFVEKVISEEDSFTKQKNEETYSDEEFYFEEPVDEVYEETVSEEIIEETDYSEETFFENPVIEDSIEENNTQEAFYDDTSIDQEDVVSSEEEYYLIVGVFAIHSNLKSYAETLEIDPENTFMKNNLNYLYIFKTNNLIEARLVRDSLEVENWIYYSNK